nr:RnfABCDGE type electron transport complex subunit D [Buchnera aphidicola]
MKKINFPYVNDIYDVRKIMLLVILSCIPGIIAKCYFFGFGTLIQILFAIVVALLLEIVVLKIRSKNVKIYLYDNSSILTAVLLGVSVPSLLPWWMMIIGVFFSIVIAKHLYGGIGQNIFNPAMLGYAVLLISFPVYMNNWSGSNSHFSVFKDIKQSVNIIFLNNDINDIKNVNVNMFPDMFTEATPLNCFKTKYHLKNDDVLDNYQFQDITFQDSWKYINISFFLGGIFLFLKKIFCWRIPVSFLITLGTLSIFSFLISKEFFLSPLVHFFSGGTMICSFFIATDPVTTSCTNIGKIIFGMVVAVLTWIIRNYTDYPDGIAFSILFANMLVPLIDYCTKTSGYGHNNI